MAHNQLSYRYVVNRSFWTKDWSSREYFVHPADHEVLCRSTSGFHPWEFRDDGFFGYSAEGKLYQRHMDLGELAFYLHHKAHIWDKFVQHMGTATSASQPEALNTTQKM